MNKKGTHESDKIERWKKFDEWGNNKREINEIVWAILKNCDCDSSGESGNNKEGVNVTKINID